MGAGGLVLCFFTVSAIVLWGVAAIILRDEFKELNDEDD